VRAVILEQTGPIESSVLRVGDVPAPAPGPGQVVIKVAACGVCRSNLHMIEGDWVGNGVPAQLPIIPGHEVVGTISALGEAVTGIKEGERVGVQPLWSTCGRCEYCLTARENLCRSKEITGETVDGGYAEFMLADAQHVHPVPDALNDIDAAPLFCPGITAYSAVAHAALGPGKTVVVFGLGGVGHMVVQFAALTGAEVIAADRNALHLDVAGELGATRKINVTDNDAGKLLESEGGVDAAIVFAPSTPLARQALRSLKPGGTLVLGVHADLGDVSFAEAKTIVGTVIGNRAQMREVLRLAAAGKVTTIATAFRLDQAEEALRLLKSGELRSRAVLTT
jgi:propanol-preferring alcohol dehydrogenase